MGDTFKFQSLDNEMHTGRGFLRDGQFYAMNNGRFYQVAPADYDVAEHITGWKFHISVDEADVPKAWDLLQEKFQGASLAAKVASPSLAKEFADPQNAQRGKMITVYEDDYYQRDMESLLKDIERTLRENGIRPGHDVENDRKLNGSAYINYRNDRNLGGAYISASDIEGYNPAGHDDPFLSVSVANLERTPYEKLNMTTGTLYNHFGIDKSWVKDGGGDTGKPESARLAVATPGQAHHIAETMQQQGIHALVASKGEQSLVIIQSSAFDTLTEDAIKTADKTMQAQSMVHRFKQSQDPYFSKIDWKVHEATEATKAPHLRAYVRDADYATALAGYTQEKTGHQAHAAQKGNGENAQHLVVLDVAEPAPSQNHLNRARQKGFDTLGSAPVNQEPSMGFER